MLYTNGVIIVDKNNDTKRMEEELVKVSDHMNEMKNEVVEFKFTDEHGFPAYKFPENITFMEMQDVLGPNIALKAINEDEIVLHGESIIEKKYDFDSEELHELADDMVKHLDQKNSLISEKAILSKQKDTEIKKVEKKIEELKVKHSNKFEDREYKVKVKLNFKDKKKYYVDINDESIVHKTDKMSKDEMQVRIDHRFDEPVEFGKGKAGKKGKEESPM